jgi:hypothetical protein
MPTTPIPGFSYASAAVSRSKPSRSISTQTDVSWKPAEQRTITWPYNPPHYKPSTTSSSSSSQTSTHSSQRDTPQGRSQKQTLSQKVASPERPSQRQSPPRGRSPETSPQGLASPPKGRKRSTAKERSSSSQSQKGPHDSPIKLQNRFESLDSMETEESSGAQTSKPTLVPILPPK